MQNILCYTAGWLQAIRYFEQRTGSKRVGRPAATQLKLTLGLFVVVDCTLSAMQVRSCKTLLLICLFEMM